jgi:hypothetical protein
MQSDPGSVLFCTKQSLTEFRQLTFTHYYESYT